MKVYIAFNDEKVDYIKRVCNHYGLQAVIPNDTVNFELIKECVGVIAPIDSGLEIDFAVDNGKFCSVYSVNKNVKYVPYYPILENFEEAVIDMALQLQEGD